MNEIFLYMKDNLPVWLVFFIILIVGFIRYGVRFLKEIVELGDSYAQKSDAVKNEYMAYLKKENERLRKELMDIKREMNG